MSVFFDEKKQRLYLKNNTFASEIPIVIILKVCGHNPN